MLNKFIHSLFLLLILVTPVFAEVQVQDDGTNVGIVTKLNFTGGTVTKSGQTATVPLGGGDSSWIGATGKVTLTTPTDNVGVGSLNPEQRLVVNGTAKATAFVGDGSGLTGISGGSAAGRVTTLSCSDDIQTKITAATAGDTLELGSCTYTITAGLTISKALTIIGQGVGSTTIASAANAVVPITITSDNVTLKNFQITGTNVQVYTILVDATAGSVFSNVTIDGLKINVSDNGTLYGMLFQDSGGYVYNNFVQVTTSGSGFNRPIGIAKIVYDTHEAITTLYEAHNTVYVTATDTNFTGNARAFYSYNWAPTPSLYNSYTWMFDNHGYCKHSDVTGGGDTECIENQGNNIAINNGVNGGVISYIYDSSFDGTTNNSACTGANNCRDYRIADYAEVWLNGVTFGTGWGTSENNGNVIRYGSIEAGRISGALPKKNVSSAGLDAISLIGQEGANNANTGSATAYTAGGFTMTGGLGGIATAATTTGTGAQGGTFTLIGGAGGSQTTSSSTTNISGAGGDIIAIAGAGGSSTNAATTNNGGNGGNVYVIGGAKGTGASANGTDGVVHLGSDSSFNHRGFVAVNASTSSVIDSTIVLDARGTGKTTIAANGFSATAANGARLWLGRAHGGTESAPTIVSTGDTIGQVGYYGYDGSVWNGGVLVSAVAEGTVTSGSLPMRWEVCTSAGSSCNRRMAITSGGNVGIGTVNPQNTFAIGTTGQLQASTAGVFHPLGTNSAPSVSFVGDTNTGLFSTGADEVNVTTGGTQRMAITSAGNVGIGSATPGAVLDVTGGIRSSLGTAGQAACWKADKTLGQCTTVVGAGGGCTCS